MLGATIPSTAPPNANQFLISALIRLLFKNRLMYDYLSRLAYSQSQEKAGRVEAAGNCYYDVITLVANNILYSKTRISRSRFEP